MKIRNGFVSNSSSASFIINKNELTDKQIRELNNFFINIKDDYGLSFWEITETEEVFKGFSIIDNDLEEEIKEKYPEIYKVTEFDYH